MSDLLTDRPDCGDNSCLFSGGKGGMRTNGGCRCLQDLPRTTQHFIARVYRSHERLERELATAKADQRKEDEGIAKSHRWNSVGHTAEFCEGFEQGCLTAANAIKGGE